MVGKREPMSEEAKRYTDWAIRYAGKSGTPNKRIDKIVDEVEKIVEVLQFQQALDDLVNFDYNEWRKSQRGW